MGNALRRLSHLGAGFRSIFVGTLGATGDLHVPADLGDTFQSLLKGPLGSGNTLIAALLSQVIDLLARLWTFEYVSGPVVVIAGTNLQPRVPAGSTCVSAGFANRHTISLSV